MPTAAHAQQTLRVPQDFSTIQAALNAAHTGDTVSVGPGTYFENLTIDTKKITLVSTAGPGVTLLDGGDLGPVLKITNVNGLLTTVDGFTFQNGSAPPSPSNFPVLTGGGIYAINSGLTVSNSTFRSIIGPSVLASQSTLSLRSSVITTTDGSACTNAGVGQHSGVFLSGDSVITANGVSVPSTILGNTISGDGSFCAGTAIELTDITTTTLIQNNILRDNLSGVSAIDAPFYLLQNLIYDNGLGAVGIEGPRSSNPSTGPATTILANNTLVNNHTSQDTLNGPFTTEIGILNAAAQVAMRNNIIVGTTQYAVLSCQSESQDSTANDTPLLLDHNDLFNTSGGLVISGSCFPNLAAPLSINGNISADPRFSSSTDLHPLAGSPVLDVGINLLNTPLTDIASSPRIADSTGKGYPVIDLGAYERAAAASSTIPTALSLQPAVFTLTPGSLSLSVKAQYFTTLGAAPFGSGNVTLLLNGIATSAMAGLDPNGNASLSLPLTSPGVYALTATLSPSLGFAPATSPVVYVLVTAQPLAATTLTIAASPSTQVLNQPVTLTIHLGSTNTSGSAQLGPVPPGDVTLLESGTILSSLQPDASGLATYTVPKPSAGSHIYTVNYAGTTMYSSASASTGVTITAPVATSLTAAATPNPAPLNTPVSCAAQVIAASGPAPTGIVSFNDGATSAGSVALTSSAQQGLVSLTLSNLSLGLHTITVTFQPDPGFSASSGTCTVNVGGDATRTTLVSSKNPASTADTVFYLASVASTASSGSLSSPAGSVSLFEGNTLLATAPLVPDALGSSTASLPANLTIPGSHILTATYIPATAASIASSAMLTETITASSAAIDLSASPNPASVTQSISLSASVRSASLSSVTISFYDGALLLGRTPPTPSGLFTVAFVLQPGSLSLGSHTLTAVASDAGGDLLGTSNSVVERVSGIASTLVLSATPAPSALAAALVTLSADLSTPLPAGTSVTGSVTFFDGSLPLGSASISPAGHAVLTASTLAVGPHTLTASYSGSSVIAPSASAPVTEQIVLNPTALQLAVPAHSIAFAPITLTARVSSSTTSTRINTPVCSPACAPVSVTFFANGPAGASTLGIVPVDASGGASLTISPAAGTYTISAAFSGSPLFAASTSATATLNVTPASTVLTLTANPNPVYQHGTVTLSAALSAPGAPASALTGNITFLEGSTTLGTATLAGAQSFFYTPQSVGSHTLTAVFSGDASLSGASASVTLTVLASDFSLSVKDTTLTIATTHHAPTTVSINATGALADLIDLTCANLPQNAHCTFSPATHDLTAQNASTGTLTVDTDALLNYAADRAPASPSGGSGTVAAALLALAIPTTLLAGMTRLRRRGRGSPRIVLPHLLAGLLLCAAAVTLSGCSGLYPPHVTPGTYTVTVTGHARSSGIEHSAPLTLVVTQ